MLLEKSPDAIAGQKRILANADNAPLDEALKHEQATFQSVFRTDRARTAMRAAQDAYDRGESIADVNGYDD